MSADSGTPQTPNAALPPAAPPARAIATGPRSIRRRLAVIFLVLGLLFALFGVFNIWRLAEVNAASAEIRDRWLISTRLLGTLNDATSDFRAAEAGHLLAPDAAEMSLDDKEIAALTRTIDDAAAGFEQLPHDPDEQRLWAEFWRDWGAYREIAGTVVDFSRTGRKKQGTLLYLSRSRAAYAAASDALGVLTNRTVASAKDASDRAEAIFRTTRMLVVLAVAGLVLMSVFVMRHIRRSVLDPMLEMAGRMRSLAANQTDIETSGTQRADEIGEMARAIVVFRDNAIELAHSQHGLKQQAAMFAEKLDEELRLADLQRNFVSMASHEFRTPLTVIDGQAQRMMKMPARGIAPAELEERARKVRMAVRRMTNLIDRLLNSLQLFDGQSELYFHPAPIDLFDLLHDVCQTYREITPGSHIVENLRDSNRMTVGDPGLLYQAFSNLLSNALKYSPAGSLVELKAHAEGGHLVVVVEDRGIGIPLADHDRLFERYHRGGNVKGVVGTGIGLYLVKMVIDLHGGSIQVESAEGKGTRCIVRLPSA